MWLITNIIHRTTKIFLLVMILQGIKYQKRSLKLNVNSWICRLLLMLCVNCHHLQYQIQQRSSLSYVQFFHMFWTQKNCTETFFEIWRIFCRRRGWCILNKTRISGKSFFLICLGPVASLSQVALLQIGPGVLLTQHLLRKVRFHFPLCCVPSEYNRSALPAANLCLLKENNVQK